MDARRVESWLELQEALFAGSWDDELRRFRPTFAFRGHCSVNYELQTSLKRLGLASHERNLLRAFQKYARAPISSHLDTTWHWLALAQHHELPTRLLDWTFSPYVALHFVTADPDRYREDGVVWCVDYRETNRALPAVLKKALHRESADVFTAEMLADVAGDLAAFDRLTKKKVVLFFEPPSLDDRIVNQFALFSLMNAPEAKLAEFLRRQKKGVRRVIIPAALKAEIRDKLDQANVNERVLFPGLDGLSRWLTRYYRPLDHGALAEATPLRATCSKDHPIARDAADPGAVTH